MTSLKQTYGSMGFYLFTNYAPVVLNTLKAETSLIFISCHQHLEQFEAYSRTFQIFDE